MKKTILATTLALTLLTGCGSDSTSNDSQSINDLIVGKTYYSVTDSTEYEVDLFDKNGTMHIDNYFLADDSISEQDTMSYVIEGNNVLLSSDGETNTCTVKKEDKSIELTCVWGSVTTTNRLWESLQDAKAHAQ